MKHEKLEVGDKIKGSIGLTKGRIGTVKKIHISGDTATVDFGSGDIWGIAFLRVESGEFKIVKK